METSRYFAGILLILVGGIMEGAFALPLKLTPKWKWENIWGAGSLMALVLVPWPVAVLTIPHLRDVYRSSSVQSLLMALLFGAGWGAGGVFFGLGVSAAGLSLGLSLIFGLIAINGSLIPLLLEHPEQLGRPSGFVVLGGIAVMICGLIVCSLAGKKKDEHQITEKGSGWYWLAVAVMGLIWAGGIVVYGLGAFCLGQFGAYKGFPMMLIASILTGNVLGFVNGEWKSAGRAASLLMTSGIALLIIAILLFGYANTCIG